MKVIMKLLEKARRHAGRHISYIPGKGDSDVPSCKKGVSAYAADAIYSSPYAFTASTSRQYPACLCVI